MPNNFRLIPKISLCKKLGLSPFTGDSRRIGTVPIILVVACLFFATQLNAQPAFPASGISLQKQSLDEIKTILSKTGDQPTQETKQTLKKAPEFECLMPEDAVEGRKIFGHDLFRRMPITPPQNLTVASDYIIGPGDEINILIWGRVNESYTLTVSRDGTILFPKTGPLSVVGMTFEEMKKFVTRQAKNIVGADANITMGRLRSIQVFVLGEVRNPGAYSLNAMSTITNALMAACGPTQIGTLRKVELKRGSKTIIKMDFYDLLLKGDKSKDLRIRNGDVIFVPIVGPLVSIGGDVKRPAVDDVRRFADDVRKLAVGDVKRPAVGDVKRPAIYELKGETRLLDLIQMAGGLNATAFRGRVQLQRIEDHRLRTIYEGDLIDIGKNPDKNFVLRDGDLVKLFSIVDRMNTMIISGAIENPGEYGVIPGETKISDVIALAGGLLYYASEKAELTRVKVTKSGPQTERFVINISKAIEGDPQHNLSLEINDYIRIKTIPEWKLYKIVTLNGEVRFPGTYTIMKGETLSSLIERAGGFTDVAYINGAVFTRVSVKELQQRQLDDSIERLEQRILAQSAITIETALTPEAAMQQQTASQQRRALITKLKAAKAKGRITIKLDALERFKGSASDMLLEDGDTLNIPEIPNQVQVIGAVYNQNAFIYDSTAKVKSYLKQTGGMTKNADEDEIYILKVDGTAISKRTVRGFMSSRLDPGDTIVVPEKIEKIAWLREVKDITQILYQIAVTAGVIIVAF
jgi:protein involved in polysaccharide export with SLBB domain